jgi:SAM-dependent methyltransferase
VLRHFGTQLSVIEHGVDLVAYFREMARILKRGGLLITSTDYWETPIDTRGQEMYGVPVRIFTKNDLEATITLAKKYGLVLTSELSLACNQAVVHWIGLDYTFAIMTLKKERSIQ